MGGAGARVLVLLDSQIQAGNRHRTLQDEGVWMLGCRGRAGGFGHISGSSFAESLWIVSSVVVSALGWRLGSPRVAHCVGDLVAASNVGSWRVFFQSDLIKPGPAFTRDPDGTIFGIDGNAVQHVGVTKPVLICQ